MPTLFGVKDGENFSKGYQRKISKKILSLA
jgi:hypothetical protein